MSLQQRQKPNKSKTIWWEKRSNWCTALCIVKSYRMASIINNWLIIYWAWMVTKIGPHSCFSLSGKSECKYNAF